MVNNTLAMVFTMISQITEMIFIILTGLKSELDMSWLRNDDNWDNIVWHVFKQNEISTNIINDIDV